MMWYGIAVLVMIIDQLTKLYFLSTTNQLYQTTAIIEPILTLPLVTTMARRLVFGR